MDNKRNNCRSTYDVYVGHVPKILPKGKIEQVFSKYGEISNSLYRIGENAAYGYVIVKFKKEKDAEALLKRMDKVNINGYEMEVKKGKINNHNFENGNGAAAPFKTVTFGEASLMFPPMENPFYAEPVLYDNNYAACVNRGAEPIPVMVEIMCTSVEDAVTFYGCLTSKYDDLQNLSIKLNSICPNLQRLLRKPALNKVYGALYEDNAWYRCFVIQCTVPSKPGLCFVQYIDYGNTAEVSYTNMVELPEPLKNLGAFAAKCTFSNLMCNPKSHSNISYLHHLINQRMSLCALSSWGIPEYQVHKCSSNGIDVIAELVRNGFAVYRTPMSPKSPPKRFSNVANSNCQENLKSKKSNSSKTHNKKTNDAHKKNVESFNGKKEVAVAINGKHDIGSANGAMKFFSEVNNNNVKVQDHVMSCGSESPNGYQQIQDFIPKKIIKRGSATADLGLLPSLEGAKTVNNLLKVDCVISSLSLVNNIRGLFPLHTDDDLINDAINLLKNEVSGIEETSVSKKPVEEAYQKYCDSLNKLKECSNQEMLVELKQKRNEQRIELLNELKEFFKIFDSSLTKKRKKIQEIITALESNSNAWMNVYLSKTPETLEDLLVEYNKEKEKKKNNIQNARENTNEKHKKFIKFLEDLQKEFSLVDGNADQSYFVNTGGKRGSWALKFEESLTDFGAALVEESSASTMVKEKNHISVIDCILEKLDVPKEKIDAECELFEKYEALYENLNHTSDFNTVFEELCTLQKNVDAMSSNCVRNGDGKKFCKALFELHTALLREGVLLENLAKASALHFPELVLEHPDLKLSEYQKHSYLLKYTWNERFFPLFDNCNRIEPSYISKLVDEPVVIKEFNIGSDSDKKGLIKKAIAWNEIKSKSLVKIKALFTNKDENVVYAVLPPIWETLYDNPLLSPVDYKLALNLLQQILVGLRDIHSRGIAHGAVHPLAILHKNGEVLLDFNFDKKYLRDKFCLNGINFQVPCADDLYKSADMYGFGCLVLWILFPNLSFSSTDQGVPNLNAFQSIIQDVLSVKDFASLAALLNVNQDLRPSSRVLLSNGFLKDLRIISGTMS